jgi:tripartite-type tricarboxylate transporter receptor subunit TctC
MNPHRFGRRVSALLLLFSSALGAAAANEPYPTGPIKFIVPFTAGGAADYLPRLIGPKLTEKWGVPIIVDNRPGGGSIIGIDAGVKSPPDGYTLTLVTNGFTIAPTLNATMPYDTLNDFASVMRVAATPHVLVVNPSLSVNSVAELVEAAKRARNFSFASVGVGTIAQLEGETLKQQSGVDMVHVPYRGVAPALTDILANTVTMMFAAVPDVKPHLDSGKLKALAVTGAKRSSLVPALPTMIESGYKDFIFEAWFGIVAPRRVPPERVALLRAEITRVLQMPDVIEKLHAQGLETPPAENFDEFMRAEVAKYKRIIGSIKVQ